MCVCLLQSSLNCSPRFSIYQVGKKILEQCYILFFQKLLKKLFNYENDQIVANLASGRELPPETFLQIFVSPSLQSTN